MKNSKTIALATRKDSYFMKAIAIVTIIFLPPTFFATLFAIPLLKWDDPKVAQPGFELYWAFSLPTTAIALSIWHIMSSERTVFAKAWRLIKVNSEQRQQEQEQKNRMVPGLTRRAVAQTYKIRARDVHSCDTDDSTSLLSIQ
jgi:hypothetical protein